MQKVQIKGWLHTVEAKATTTQNNQQLLKVVLIEPAYVDSFGEKKGNDQYFEVLFFNEKIKGIPKEIHEAAEAGEPVKVQCTAFLNGNKRENDGKLYFNTFLAGTEILILK